MVSSWGDLELSSCLGPDASQGLIVVEAGADGAFTRSDVLGVDAQSRACLLHRIGTRKIPALPRGDALEVAIHWQPSSAEAPEDIAMHLSDLGPAVGAELASCLNYRISASITTLRDGKRLAVWPSSSLGGHDTCVMEVLRKHHALIPSGLKTVFLFFSPSDKTHAVRAVDEAKRAKEPPVYGGLSGDDTNQSGYGGLLGDDSFAPALVPELPKGTLVTHFISGKGSRYENAHFEFSADLVLRALLPQIVACPGVVADIRITADVDSKGSIAQSWVDVRQGSEAHGECVDAALRTIALPTGPKNGARITLNVTTNRR